MLYKGGNSEMIYVSHTHTYIYQGCVLVFYIHVIMAQPPDLINKLHLPKYQYVAVQMNLVLHESAQQNRTPPVPNLQINWGL